MADEFVDELDGIQVKVYKPSDKIDLPITIYFLSVIVQVHN
ncbi:Lipase%2C GDXG family [Vibrio cholerae]|nr:Lipase%2C GDXG family [Vibrio cholerae]